jgi:hypothetical protein
MAPKPKFSFYVKGTLAQLEILIAELLRIGFVWNSTDRHDYGDRYDVLNIGYEGYPHGNIKHGLGYYHTKRNNAPVIDFNLDLALALARVPDGDKIQVNDWVVREGEVGKNRDEGGFFWSSELNSTKPVGQAGKIGFVTRVGGESSVEVRYEDGLLYGDSTDSLRKATFEEIVEYFNRRAQPAYTTQGLRALIVETPPPFVEESTVSNAFILDAHKAACADWKVKIEKEFPHLFQKQIYKLGDRFTNRYSQDIYQLVRVGFNSVNFLNLNENALYSYSGIDVSSTEGITQNEVEARYGTRFTRINA